jgi:hypothetical protein
MQLTAMTRPPLLPPLRRRHSHNRNQQDSQPHAPLPQHPRLPRRHHHHPARSPYVKPPSPPNVYFSETGTTQKLTSPLHPEYTFGFLIYLIPHLQPNTPSAARAKSLWKYHRIVGYTALALLLATVAAAAETDYNKSVLGIRLWSVLLAEGLIVAGVVPRVHLGKMLVGGGHGQGQR